MVCRKVSYPTRVEAKRDVKIITANRKRYTRKAKNVRKSNKKLRPYKCLRCGFWHLTSRASYRS